MFFKKKKSSNGAGDLTIFFASDLHGSQVCFKKFVNGAKFYGADVLVMGGDLTGKAVIPVAEQTNGTFLAFQHGKEVTLTGLEEVEDFNKRAGNMGFYPTIVTEAEYQALSADPDAQHELFKKLVVERVQEWADYAAEKLAGTDIPLITAPGNDDFFEIDPVLNNAPHVSYHEMEVTDVKGYQMLHCGGSNKTPWDTEREYSEEQYTERLAELVAQIGDMRRCIFNVHVPPHGTVLDACPKLDEKLQVVFEMGNPVQMHAGSTALLDSIKEHQPLLGLHGHIHEGRGNIKIGQTVCVNPGSVYPEGILQGVLIKIRGGEIKGVQLTQG
jgi:Icc-related predicted phosphoesterase